MESRSSGCFVESIDVANVRIPACDHNMYLLQREERFVIHIFTALRLLQPSSSGLNGKYRSSAVLHILNMTMQKLHIYCVILVSLYFEL